MFETAELAAAAELVTPETPLLVVVAPPVVAVLALAAEVVRVEPVDMLKLPNAPVAVEAAPIFGI
jgi:hypothetical protein